MCYWYVSYWYVWTIYDQVVHSQAKRESYYIHIDISKTTRWPLSQWNYHIYGFDWVILGIPFQNCIVQVGTQQTHQLA